MLLKCCTQFVSKFGKLSSGYRNGKGQFSFQCQIRVMPKKVLKIVQLHLILHASSLYSKSIKRGFSSMWIENIQMCKLSLEKAGEQKSNCQHSFDNRAKEFQKKSISASLTTWKPLTMWITKQKQTNMENS